MLINPGEAVLFPVKISCSSCRIGGGAGRGSRVTPFFEEAGHVSSPFPKGQVTYHPLFRRGKSRAGPPLENFPQIAHVSRAPKKN